MRYLHTMVRVENLERALDFYCAKLGLEEIRRTENEKGRFTLVFLAAPADAGSAEQDRAPEIELTYNWDTEDYAGGRNFGHLAYEVDDISIELLQKGQAKDPAEPWSSMGNTGVW